MCDGEKCLAIVCMEATFSQIQSQMRDLSTSVSNPQELLVKLYIFVMITIGAVKHTNTCDVNTLNVLMLLIGGEDAWDVMG